MHPKIKTSTLAYNSIKEMIFQYQLIPGQKITYDFLARKLKVSNTPIINALHRLEQEDIVVSIPNRGFVIRDVNIEEVEEYFRIRAALEMLAIEDAIKNHKPKQLRELNSARRIHQEFKVFSRNRLVKDAAFHLKIAEIGGNRLLARLLKHLFEFIYLRLRTESLPFHRIAETIEEHQEIYTAIENKNLIRARAYIKRHIAQDRKATIEGIHEANTAYIP
jgi:DNA-binding GntR family transcriptional regulator